MFLYYEKGAWRHSDQTVKQGRFDPKWSCSLSNSGLFLAKTNLQLKQEGLIIRCSKVHSGCYKYSTFWAKPKNHCPFSLIVQDQFQKYLYFYCIESPFSLTQGPLSSGEERFQWLGCTSSVARPAICSRPAGDYPLGKKIKCSRGNNPCVMSKHSWEWLSDRRKSESLSPFRHHNYQIQPYPAFFGSQHSSTLSREWVVQMVTGGVNHLSSHSQNLPPFNCHPVCFWHCHSIMGQTAACLTLQF